MPYELSIIIVNWNGGGLHAALRRDDRQFWPATTYEIVIIDNASADDSLDQLRAGESLAPLANRQIRIFNN